MTDDDGLGPYFAAAGAALTFNSPLGDARVADLLDRLAPASAGARALDLGCGTGELLLRLCERHGIGGDGVDEHVVDVERARRRAAELGLAERVTFHAADAREWDRPAALVLNVGAGYAWGDTPAALAALRGVTAPGGTLLFADGFYEREPGPACREIFGDLPDLAGTERAAVGAGFRVQHVATSTTEEWDDFEATWRSGVERLDTPGARDFARQRREEYETVYRGVVGFAWLVLTPA